MLFHVFVSFRYFYIYIFFFRTLIFTFINIALKRQISAWPPLSQTRLPNSRSGSARGNQEIRIRYNARVRILRKLGLRNSATSCGSRRFETEVIRHLCYVYLKKNIHIFRRARITIDDVSLFRSAPGGDVEHGHWE